MRQADQSIGPKSPYRAEKLRKNAEKQDRSSQGAQHQETPQLAVGPAQQEQEGHRPHGEAVDAIQKAGEPGPAESEGPQQVVQHPCGQPQQDGLTEGHQLV